MQTKLIQIGEIVKPQGIRGEVKLKAMSSDMSRYARLESVFLQRGRGEAKEYKVKKGRSYDGFAFLTLEGVNDRDAAEALRGYGVYVDRAHAIELDEDENFIDDLIGLTAVDTKGNEIGELVDVLTPNSICDVYVFDTPRGQLMIPALKRVVVEVDLDEETIVLDEEVLPEVAVWEDDESSEIRE
ncbi:MAG: 16S rRNA processing protein RimM [Clostridia bacterium]|nr:16S rRNA processing protein RimM [Clostridia bacterium]